MNIPSYFIYFLQSGIMGFTATGNPLVRPSRRQFTRPSHYEQVGPVVDNRNLSGQDFAGLYISAGFSGHGMPRATAW